MIKGDAIQIIIRPDLRENCVLLKVDDAKHNYPLFIWSVISRLDFQTYFTANFIRLHALFCRAFKNWTSRALKQLPSRNIVEWARLPLLAPVFA